MRWTLDLILKIGCDTQLPKTIADVGEYPTHCNEQQSPHITKENDALFALRHEQDGRDYKRPKLEG